MNTIYKWNGYPSAYGVNHLHGYGYTWMLPEVNSGMTLDQGCSVGEYLHTARRRA